MRRKRKRLIFALLALLFLYILFSITKHARYSFFETITTLVCDEERGKSVIHDLCLSYDHGEVTGNLCPDLCKTGKLVIEQCLSHKNDNVIFSAKWRQRDVILKSKKMSFHDSWEDMFPDSASMSLVDLQRNFFRAVYDNTVSQLFHFKDFKNYTLPIRLSSKELLTQLYFNSLPTNLARNEMKSLWLLLRQDEYYLFQLLKDFKHIPKIFGTCGGFYALEKVKTLVDFVGVALFSAPVTWRLRVKLALEVLDLVEEFDSKLVYGLTWDHCDVQPSNFGVDKAGTIKAIDVDLMYTNEKILEILSQDQNSCSSHEDCEFFDCTSLCDFENKKCTAIKVSNNLQVVCRDLFQPTWYESGLLSSIPPRSETKLTKILNECAAVTTVPWTKRKYGRIFNTIKRYLLEEQTNV